MRTELKRRGYYFDTYNIYDENNNLIGMYEDHCRGVKSQYFVGWANLKPFCGSYTGDTKSFDNREEAINYAIGKENPTK